MSDTAAPDHNDRVALYLSVGIAAIGAIATLTTTIARLLEVAPGHDIPVSVPLEGLSVGLPLGPDGAQVNAHVDVATVNVADPAPATLFALWAQPIWLAIVVLAGLALAAMFFLRVARGRVFSRGASRLAIAGAVVVGAGWVGGTILTNMTTNGALAALSGGTYDSVTFTVSMAPFVAILLLGGLGGALQIGERLNRDTEGLV